MAREQPKMDGLGQALRFLRSRSGLHQEDVALAIPTTRSSVGAWEQSKHDPSPANLERYLRAVGCTFRDLDRALREVRGEESAPRRTNGDPAPDLEGLTRDAWATRRTQDLVSREVDRRVARIMRDILGHDPRALAGEDRQGEPARGQG